MQSETFEWPITLLKLGGSLITEKTRPYTTRPDVIKRLASEIAQAKKQRDNLHLILGHGSGSFGHQAASHYHTRQGVHTKEEWAGFTEVWQEASTLHRIVIETMSDADLPVISFPPSASVIAANGKVIKWDLSPLISALGANLIPVVFGDVVFDTRVGGTILSTEDLFFYLTQFLPAKRILLAGIEDGVWHDFPQNTHLIPKITPQNFSTISRTLKGSTATDVTGGMAEKVKRMLEATQLTSGLEINIFSGMKPGQVCQALLGEPIGTTITS